MSGPAATAPKQGWTKGPWRLSRTRRYVMEGYGAPWVCEVKERPECGANALLIAAAPDLYEVVSKAETQSVFMLEWIKRTLPDEANLIFGLEDLLSGARSALAKATVGKP